MKINKFEEIIAWQKAQRQTLDLYNYFENIKDYEFKKQILRASISISNNIAEGFDRNSNLDFKKFLFYSTSSNSEVRSMLYLAYHLKYVNKEQFENLQSQSIEISKMLSGLIKSISNK